MSSKWSLPATRPGSRSMACSSPSSMHRSCMVRPTSGSGPDSIRRTRLMAQSRGLKASRSGLSRRLRSRSLPATPVARATPVSARHTDQRPWRRRSRAVAEARRSRCGCASETIPASTRWRFSAATLVRRRSPSPRVAPPVVRSSSFTREPAMTPRCCRPSCWRISMHPAAVRRRSKRSLADLTGAPHSIAIHRGAEDYDDVVACGDITSGRVSRGAR